MTFGPRGAHDKIHEQIYDEIRSRMAVPSADNSSTAADSAYVEFEHDLELLKQHWSTAVRLLPDGSPTFAKGCGEPQPCPHTLGLAQKYGIID